MPQPSDYTLVIVRNGWVEPTSARNQSRNVCTAWDSVDGPPIGLIIESTVRCSTDELVERDSSHFKLQEYMNSR